MEKGGKKWLIVILVLVILILAVLAYFLFFKGSSAFSFGFSNPDYSPSQKVGDIVGQAADSNSWKDAKLNPFRNESS